MCKRHGGDKRGSSADRRRRKSWLLTTFGDGVHCLCTHRFEGCLEVLTYETVEADRIAAGGSYCRTNIQPSCGPCNKKRYAEENRVECDTTSK